MGDHRVEKACAFFVVYLTGLLQLRGGDETAFQQDLADPFFE